MKLFVGGLPLDLYDDELHEIFSDYGTVKSAKVIVNHRTRSSKGFGFVEFVEPDNALAAMKALQGGSIDGKKLTVKPAEERRAAKADVRVNS